MALDTDMDLYSFLDPNQAATLRETDRFTDETSEGVFHSLTKNIKKCNYCDLNQNQFFISRVNSLVLLHVNIRSLHKNFDSFHDFLIALNVSPDVICLTETRIRTHLLSNIEIPNYSFVHVDSKSAAGGVAIYVSCGLQYELCPIQHHLHDSESLWINLFENKPNNNYTIGVIYRHPSQVNINDFLECFSNCLTNLSKSKNVYYILGDFNLNIQSDNRTNYATEYINLIVSNGAFPIITKPTRVTENSATIIDHIITNDAMHVLEPAIIKTDLTDHYPIICSVEKFQHKAKSKAPKIYHRDRSRFCPESFCEELESNLFDYFSTQPALDSGNFNKLFDDFARIILSAIDSHAPIKYLSRKQMKLHRKPWITKGILISIKKKNSMFKTHYINGNLNNKSYFKKYSNKLTKIKALSKKLFFTNKLQENHNNPREMWNVIRSTLPNGSKHSSPNIESLHINGNKIADSQQMANHFNDFFCNIGARLAKAQNISDTNSKLFNKYLRDRISKSIYLDVPNYSEIINTIFSINMNKAVGHDNLPPFFLRVASTVITPYLHSFMEYSFINGIFPGNCTIARIVPIFKKGERDKPTNYRPISILSCFTKIFEKIIYKRLINFLNKHNVIQKTQYGFQKNISTNHALIDVITNSFDNINNNLYTGLVFLDLTKAFDTVSHDILLHKLDHYGIRGKTNDLIQTFLQRKQFVSVNGVNSNVLANNYGVAQGSTLGPLLFLLYINDLPSSVNCVPRFFADDTCLVYSSSNPSTLNTAINQDLKNISQWFKANKLTVNPSKSNVLIIPPKLNKTVPNMNFFLNNTLIQQSSSVKYLGVIIDFKLSFDIHIKSLEHKISRAVGIMSKLKYFMPKNALQTIYYSFIQSHLIYGLPVWGSTYHSYLKKLRILQNKAVKFIGGDLFQDRITPLYAQSNILKLPNLYKLEVSKLVHAHIRNQLPHKLSNYFTFTSNISSRNTRTTQKKNHLYTPRYKTSRMQKCIKYQGVKIWNDIPSEIQNSNSKNFKKKMKKHLLTLQS